MFWRARSFWLSVAAVAYAAFAALEAQSSGRGTSGALPSAPPTLLGRGLPWLSMVALPIVLGAVWTMTAAPTRGEDRVDAAARSAARAAWAGAAIVLAAMTGPPTPGLAATANLGTAIATMAALVALARLSPMGGLVVAPESARGLDAVAFASLLWTVAIALPLARAVGVARAAALDPVVLDGAAVAASLGALGLATATALRIAVTRRLELGVAERADAALWLSATAVAVGVLGAAVGVGVPERLLPVTAVVASLAIVACAAVPDPAVLARTLRVVLAVAGLAAPFALGAVYVTQAAPRRAAATVFVSCVACALAGLAAPLVAARLTRSLRRTLGLLHQAITAATNPDPDLAVEAALHALGEGAALYRVVSGAGGAGDKLTVDRAGYAHTETAELPAALVEVADQEPERVLRAAAARAVEVRRPELRPIVAWLDRQRVAAVAVVRDETAPVALIALPTAPDGRAAPAASLEEVRALRALADRLGSVIGVSAALGRSRERELAGRAELGRVGDEARRLLAERDRDAAQRIALTRMLERPARVASYSPAARAAVEQLERMGEAGRPIALLSAPGVDAVAWAALAHLASPRRAGPFAVVDATSPVLAELAHWRDAELSPLRAAQGGSLVVIDAHALPLDVQSYLAAALPEEGLGIIVSLPATVDALAAAGRLSERLADRLGDRTVALPPLEARAEDLRALALEHLARIGVRLGREPLGLAPKALTALLDHTWPGNDAELHATLLRAAIEAEGEVIGVADLKRVGFAVGARPLG